MILWIVAIFGAASCAILLFLLMSRTLVYLPNTRVGVVEKLFAAKGSVPSGLIALEREAGYQPRVLRGGWHLLAPFQCRIHRVPLVTVPQGQIGYVFARDGAALPATQTLAANHQAWDFQDAEGFLKAGGQKGPQRLILREGTYAINLALFVVLTQDHLYYLPLDKSELEVFGKMSDAIADRRGFQPIILRGEEDRIAVITVHDGPALSAGEIIAPLVGNDPAAAGTYHNNFQDPDKFLAAGGLRGRQLQVLVEGTYYVNRLFATEDSVPKTVVEVGSAGVVVSYTGATGLDLSGQDYKHGELVAVGERGVWSEPLLPGKYAFNTCAGKVTMVPTTNFILKWNRDEVGTHRFDENLAEVSLITKDAFEPSLPLSVVVHIDYRKAPLVIQRFGDIKRLVEQTLDPMVSAYFKNVAQTRTLIELIHDRAALQAQASVEMKDRFAVYNLELEEVLIGTPNSGSSGGQIEQILTQLRSRQIAEEQVETYTRQERASAKERELREAEAKARQQTMLTESEVSIAVASNHGKADFARAQQQASQIQTLAQAEAEKTRILAEGEAKKIRLLAESEADRAARVGIAQAMAIEEQVRAYGGPRFQLTQQVMQRFAEAVEKSQVDVVPKIQMGSTNGGGLIEGLLSVLLAERVGETVDLPPVGVANAQAERLRADLRKGLERGGEAGSSLT